MPILLFAAFASLVAVFQGIQNILVPQAVQRLAPDTKVSVLALLTTLSAVATLAAFVAGGMLSDRTRTRFGRRTPWLVGMAVASIAVMIAMAFATSIAALAVLMPLLWFCANFYQAAIIAILPDRIPIADRGFASAAIALGAPIGIFVGVNVAALTPTPLLGYGLLSLPLALATTALVLLGREPSSLGHALPRAVGGARQGVLLGAFRSRDFTLTFVSRFVLFLSFYTVNGYLFYVLQDHLGADALPGGSAARAVSVIMTVKTIAWLLVTPVTGILADRVGHTAGIVAATSIGIGLVMLTPILSDDWAGMVAWGIGIGLTFGIYYAIDLKLASLVLPSPDTAGRDMGIIGIAASAPNILAPALAAAIIEIAGFRALFVSSALLAAVGGLAALPIRTRSPVRRREADRTQGRWRDPIDAEGR